jgi:hypothetical protein
LGECHAERVANITTHDLNVALHEKIRRKGVQVAYGDIANAETLKHAHIEDAEVVVVTIPGELLRRGRATRRSRAACAGCARRRSSWRTPRGRLAERQVILG